MSEFYEISYSKFIFRIFSFLGKFSKEISVFLGVPQGSHLVPFLFHIFVSELSDVLKGIRHLFYADDLKIFHTIKTPSDIQFLQGYLVKLASWTNSI